MLKNVGKIDRSLRLLLAIFLIWLGLFYKNGIQGELIGILIACCSLLPIYMGLTGSCFVFRWANIHSLSKKEVAQYGNPTEKK